MIKVKNIFQGHLNIQRESVPTWQVSLHRRFLHVWKIWHCSQKMSHECPLMYINPVSIFKQKFVPFPCNLYVSKLLFLRQISHDHMVSSQWSVPWRQVLLYINQSSFDINKDLFLFHVAYVAQNKYFVKKLSIFWQLYWK